MTHINKSVVLGKADRFIKRSHTAIRWSKVHIKNYCMYIRSCHNLAIRFIFIFIFLSHRITGVLYILKKETPFHFRHKSTISICIIWYICILTEQNFSLLSFKIEIFQSLKLTLTVVCLNCNVVADVTNLTAWAIAWGISPGVGGVNSVFPYLRNVDQRGSR